MKKFGIDCQGGKGMAGFGVEVCPTCAAISHGTPHALAITRKRLVCTMDMMGGKPGCHFSRENVSPTFTKGRASVNDIHLVCRVGK